MKEYEFYCKYCNKGFSNERILISHFCEPKRRYNSRNDKDVKAAFAAYEYFCKRNTNKKEITQSDFEKSSYYSAFVRFGRFIIENDIPNMKMYMDFLFKYSKEISLDNWTDKHIYDAFWAEVIKTESPDTAVERSIKFIFKWSAENDLEWTDFFEKVSTNRAIVLIQSGRISPWLIFLSNKSHLLLNRFTEEQINLIKSNLNINIWDKKIKAMKTESDRISKLLLEFGI